MNLRHLIFSGLFFVFIISIAEATPHIDSVEGYFLRDKNISIQGNNFGIKDPAYPIVWINFENGINEERAEGIYGFDEAGINTTFSNELSNSGNMACKMSWTENDSGFSRCRGTEFFQSNYGEGTKIYFYSKMYFKSPWSWECSPRVKIMRIRIRDNLNNHIGYLSILSNTNGNIVLSNEIDDYEPSTNAYLETNKWIGLSMYVNLSAVNPLFKIWKNNKLVIEDIDYKTLRESSDLADFIHLMSYWNGGPSQNQVQYIDDVYVDNTQARIEICNESVWNESREMHCEIQIPVEWNNNSITFTFNQGSFEDNSTVYLFVIDENGNVSNGYPLTIKPQNNIICEATSGHNCYYVAPQGNDSNNGSFYYPFKSVQKGVDSLNPGDYLYLRDGTYKEHVEIRPYNKPQGNPNEWYVVKSYPGEWAVLNPEYDSECPVIFYGISSCGTHGSHGYDFCPQYWKFERFEITGGGIDNEHHGSGIDFDTAANIIFDHLYIHDNRGSSSTNNGGIVIRNDNNAGSNITIQHCYLKDNACSDLHNCGNIVLFSDYNENPENVDINSASRNNTIRYNLIEGSAVGLKYKNSQWLSLDHSGNDIRYYNYGDKIYHNIFINQGDSAILGGHDFYQIYENVFNNSKIIDLGNVYGGDREPFYAFFYNNLLIKTRFSLSHDDDSAGDGSSYNVPSDENDYHPYIYIYNNIFENIGSESNGRNDINIFFTWTKDYQNYLNMSTVHIENNLFIPRSENEEIINIGDDNNDYTSEQYILSGYSKTIYASMDYNHLHTPYNRYKLNMSFQINKSKGIYIYNAGIGIPHPYLEGVNIPSYIGPCSDENCSWVDEVLGLSNISNMIESTNKDNNKDLVIISGYPSGNLSFNTKSIIITINTNKISECRYSADSDDIYSNMHVFDNTNSLHHTSLITGLKNSELYRYYVMCKDNNNYESYTVQFYINKYDADSNHDGNIDVGELLNAVSVWRENSININEIIEILKIWKNS